MMTGIYIWGVIAQQKIVNTQRTYIRSKNPIGEKKERKKERTK
jgi:hypothetical protein